MDKDSLGKQYENIAQIYAGSVDTNPMHVYHARPHLWSLLPKHLSGLNILDLGCGPGWYAEQLLKAGAKVTAIDNSPTMVELTKNRLKNTGNFYLCDLEQPLNFLENNYFDIIIAPLVIHYVYEWLPLFKNLAQVLKHNGLFIFSTHNPLLEMNLFNLDNYFQKKLVSNNWKDLGEIKHYHHTLHELMESLYQSGFIVERLIEPQPLPELENTDPELYKHLMTKPRIFFIKAILKKQ